MVVRNEPATYATPIAAIDYLRQVYVVKYNANPCGIVPNAIEKIAALHKKSHAFGQAIGPVSRPDKYRVVECGKVLW
jgi:hypothetical protein